MANNNTFKMPPDRQRWRSIALRPLIVALLLLSELGLIAGIITLWILSALHAGFVNVGFRNSGSGVFNVRDPLSRVQPLLWTTLPTLVFTLYRILREAVVSALVIETPFMELHKSSITQRSKVRKTVYVDYRTSFNIVAWYKALRNRYTFLGLCMLLSFVVSLALVPLAGGLFTEGEELLASNVAVHMLSKFNSSVDISVLDYGGLCDAVSASWVNAAPYPVDTDGYFPLPRIESIQGLENYTVSSAAETSQLSLDCRLIDDATIATQAETENILRTTFSANDRDCAVSGDILTVSTENPNLDYFKTYSEQDCPVSAGRTRVILFYVKAYSSGEVQNSTLVSCIPAYWAVNGTVSINRITSLTGRLDTPSFEELSRAVEELPGMKRQQFEQGIMNVQTINVGSDVNSPLRLSELVARYIDSKNLDFSGGALVEALSTIYAAIYTMLCVNNFYPTLAQPIQQDGILRIPENRLHVVVAVAIAMLAILVLLIAETVYLIVHLHSHPSILAEEPIGLVGAANLLHDSNIPCLIAKFHEEPAFDGRLRKCIVQASAAVKKSKARYTDDELLDRDCWVEQEPDSGRLRIVVETKAGDDQCAKLLHGHTSPECGIAPVSQPHTPRDVSEQPLPTSTPSTWLGWPNHVRIDQAHDILTHSAPVQRKGNAQQGGPPYGGRQPHNHEVRNEDIDLTAFDRSQLHRHRRNSSLFSVATPTSSPSPTLAPLGTVSPSSSPTHPSSGLIRPSSTSIYSFEAGEQDQYLSRHNY